MKLGKAIKHNIIIEPTMNGGFYVTIGCGRFAFSNKKDLSAAIIEYLKNPEFLEEEYNKVVSVSEEPSVMNALARGK